MARTYHVVYMQPSLPWTPADLGSGLYAWYESDHDNNTYSGSDYDTLYDLSGNGRTAIVLGTAPTVDSGIGGVNCMRYNGTDPQRMLVPTSTAWSQDQAGLTSLVVSDIDPADDASPTFRAVVFAPTGTSGNSTRFGLVSSDAVTNQSPGLYARRLDADVSASSVLPASAQTAPAVLVGIADYANSDGYISVNGTLSTNTSFGSSGNTSNTPQQTYGVIIGNTGFGDAAHKGLIRIVVLIQEAVSSADRERLEGWAAWKCGLQGNLPISHPYKSVPPFT